ncbi:MAG TPA: membrane protein insertase YidC [Treponema sp.]|nr:membrane protein insertase YidC [Treponema sp.]HBB43519.1 membrane protein insertase YidC [Treponema sp.]HCA20555.1 membrane protein insertase YidC [Treponema sp.]
MEKNTVWAIGLSTLVLVGSLIVEYKVILPKQQAAMEKQQAELALKQEEQAKVEKKAEEQFSTAGEIIAGQPEIEEKHYTITTDKVEAVFTSRGGDLISYKLLEHNDKDTGSGVQMVDNVTATNRAFSLGFGQTTETIVNENFAAKMEGDNTIIFTREFNKKDDFGNIHTFTLMKRYEFLPGEYVFRMGVGIKLDDGNGLESNGAAYTIRTSPQIGPHFDRKHDRYEVRQLLLFNGKKREKPSLVNKEYEKEYQWVGVGGKYFTILIKPEDPSKMTTKVVTSSKSESDYENSQVFISRSSIAPGASVAQDVYYVYIGPRSEQEYKRYNLADDNGWGLSNAKFNHALATSGVLSWIEVVLKWGMEMIYRLVRNWGVAIIILTVILRIILFPLSRSSAIGTLKMQQLQPKMQEIQEKYKDNQQKLAEETSKLYKEAGYNPMSGCLPMILQMVILFALYNVFNNYFEFRGATFIRGWIDDLSMGDKIWTWKKDLPFITTLTQNTLRILPFIYLFSQLLNGKITQYGGAAGGQSAGQMKFMMYGLPIIFFFMFYNVPSGLLLYWTVSNILQIGQQIMINNTMKKKRAEMEKNKPAVNANVLKFKGGKKKTR